MDEDARVPSGRMPSTPVLAVLRFAELPEAAVAERFTKPLMALLIIAFLPRRCFSDIEARLIRPSLFFNAAFFRDNRRLEDAPTPFVPFAFIVHKQADVDTVAPSLPPEDAANRRRRYPFKTRRL